MLRFAVVCPDNAIVHMHAGPVLSRRSRAGVKQSIYYLTRRLQFVQAVQPQQARYGCVIVQIQGGLKTKQAASAPNGPLG